MARRTPPRRVTQRQDAVRAPNHAQQRSRRERSLVRHEEPRRDHTDTLSPRRLMCSAADSTGAGTRRQPLVRGREVLRSTPARQPSPPRCCWRLRCGRRSLQRPPWPPNTPDDFHASGHRAEASAIALRPLIVRDHHHHRPPRNVPKPVVGYGRGGAKRVGGYKLGRRRRPAQRVKGTVGELPML